MPGFSFGGASVVALDFTKSWGLSPASGSITAVGEINVEVGGDAVLTLGGSSFFGVLADIVQATRDGTDYRISFVDNRVKLMWDDVYCVFNRCEVRPLVGGEGLLKKRYAHIFPEDWAKQIKTYTDAPLSAQAIIGHLLHAPTVRYGWGASYHALQSHPCHEIDCNNGKKLGNALQEVTDAQGLVFTLDGALGLRWVLKGDGDLPELDYSIIPDRSQGEAISAVDTQVTIVGDRNRYQDVVDLIPDWVGAYEAFLFEGTWLEEVSGAFGMSLSTFSDWAAVAAKARSVTLREYAGMRGDQMLDSGRWGEVARNDIPVWVYLQDIVYKAYRIPTDYSYNGVPLDSLELEEGLLAECDYDLSGGSITPKTPRKYYPESKAFVILARAASLWTPNNKFNLDVKNKTIIFEDPIFVSTGLYIFPNADAAGASESLRSIAVPNANLSMQAAAARAAVVWAAEKFAKVYGSGKRKGPHYVQGLQRDVLPSGEVTDDQQADEKADKIAQSLIAREQVYPSGRYLRDGITGTQLTGAIDRVTVKLNFAEGISETVDFSKERPQSNFENEREMERRHRSRDLFPGQREVEEQAKKLKEIAAISKELPRSPVQAYYENINHIMEKPVGCVDPAVQKVFASATFNAGTPIFLGDDDKVDQSKKRFAGVTIAQGASGSVPVATQGVVPVRVKGPFKIDDAVGVPGGADYAQSGADRNIGTVASPDYTGTDIVVALVRLGKFKDPRDFTFKLFDATNETGPRVLILDGEINGELPTGMGNDDFTLPLTNDDEADPDTSGENVIYAFFTHNLDGEILTREVRVDSPDGMESSGDQKKVVVLGYALVHSEDGHRGITQIRNRHCGDIIFKLYVWPHKTAFELIDASDSDGTRVRVNAGHVNGAQSAGTDVVVDCSGYVEFWLAINYSTSTGGFIGSAVTTTNPGSANGRVVLMIGYAQQIDGPEGFPIMSTNNYQASDIQVNICRDWFSYPVNYSLSFA
jgi:hypothetical protein